MRLRTLLGLFVLASAVSAPAHAENLLVNPSFHSGLAGWDVSLGRENLGAWSENDENGYGGSAVVASMTADYWSLQTPFRQCVNVPDSASSFRLQGKINVPSGQPKEGNVDLFLYWCPQPDCGGWLEGPGASIDSATIQKDTWVAIDQPISKPANARSALIQLGVIKDGARDSFMASFDDLAFFVEGTGTDSLIGYVPVAGSLRGAHGANFKTAMQLTNPGTGAIDVRLVFHPSGRSALAGDPSRTLTIDAGRTVAFDDVVADMAQTGLGTMDVYSTLGRPWPIVITRVFNEGGSAGTTGFTEPVCDFPSPYTYGEATLVGPSDTERLRLNIGVRTFAKTVHATIEVYDAAGVLRHSLTSEFDPNYHQQYSPWDFLGGFELGPNQRILIHADAPAMFYGALTDNVTNDPSVQFAMTR